MVVHNANRLCARQPGPRKIMAENLSITHPAPRRHVRSFLTKPKHVTEAADARCEIIPSARNYEPRAFDHLPSQTSSDNDLEIPTSNQTPPRALNSDDFSPARRIAFGDGDRNEPRAGVRAFVALQCFCELICRNLLRPAAMRRRRTEIVANAAKIGRRGRAPQRLDVRSHSAARGMKIGVNHLPRTARPGSPA